jgi:hypothetical protein
MLDKLSVHVATAGLLLCAAATAAEIPIAIKSDPEGRHAVVEQQGTSENPVLITRRAGPDGRIHYMKRSIDCRKWAVRNLGEGPTLDAMNKGQPDPEPSTIEAGSIPDHYARQACPPPHPATKP